MELLIALAMLAVGFVLWNLYQRLTRRQLDWTKLAAGTGFTFYPGNEFQWPLMRGEHKGYEVRLTAEPGDERLSAAATSRVVLFLREELPEGLFVARNGMLGALESVFHMEQLELGEPELDQLLLIKGRTEDEVYLLMADTGVRRALISFFQLYSTAQITSSAISVVLPTLVAGVRDLREVLDEILRVADILEDATRITSAEEVAEGRRSSVDTKIPEVRYSQPQLSSLFDEDMALRGESSDDRVVDDTKKTSDEDQPEPPAEP